MVGYGIKSKKNIKIQFSQKDILLLNQKARENKRAHWLVRT